MVEVDAQQDEAETIEVRVDEQLDVGALTAYLKGKLEGPDHALEIRQFGGGHANLTYLLRFGEGTTAREYVLRRPPKGPVAKGAHDMKREYRALSHLWQLFPPAPRAYVLCEDHSVLGVDFFVMERRRGVVVRRRIPEVLGGGRDPEANLKLSEVLIDTLVELHAVDPRGGELAELGHPEGFLERQVKGWGDRFERCRTSAAPMADELLRWLETNLPESSAPTLLHNDWKLDNMAVAADDPGQCVAVYDWDMCTRGDPLCDLGTLPTSWLDPGEMQMGATAMPTAVEGFLPREAGIARYAERSGRDLGNIAYYHVFGTFKMGVVLQQIYYRFHRGQTRDSRFAGMEKLAQMLFEQASGRRP